MPTGRLSAALIALLASLSLALGASATASAHTTRRASACEAHARSTRRHSCKAPIRRGARPTPKPKPKPKPKATKPSVSKKTTPKPATKSTTTTPAPTPAPTPPPVASTAPCANGDLTPDATNIPVVEAATLCLVNQVRGEHGLPALVPNADLQESAVEHNNDMVSEDYFDHVGPHGDTPLTRIEATGYLNNGNLSYIIGENIAWGTLDLSTPAAIVNAWVNSPDHLANILQPDYTDSGLAVAPEAPASLAQGQPGAIYTQDFGGIDSGDN